MTTAQGCVGSDNIVVKVYQGPEIYVPTGFTPNDDGKNDFLRPIAVGMKSFQYFRVYNRWGQLIFSTVTANAGWDGKINGVKQPTGTYVWIAEATDYKGNRIQRRGSTVLIR
jgi:gliding motility-associated-like protein